MYVISDDSEGSGEWKEVNECTFTCSAHGNDKLCYDFYGAVDKENNGFLLKAYGFENDHTEPHTKLNRDGGGTAPVIDFDALEKLPSAKQQ